MWSRGDGSQGWAIRKINIHARVSIDTVCYLMSGIGCRKCMYRNITYESNFWSILYLEHTRDFQKFPCIECLLTPPVLPHSHAAWCLELPFPLYASYGVFVPCARSLSPYSVICAHARSYGRTNARTYWKHSGDYTRNDAPKTHFCTGPLLILPVISHHVLPARKHKWNDMKCLGKTQLSRLRSVPYPPELHLVFVIQTDLEKWRAYLSRCPSSTYAACAEKPIAYTSLDDGLRFHVNWLLVLLWGIRGCINKYIVNSKSSFNYAWKIAT